MHTQIRFAIKSLWKNKVFTIINIFGLALGLSVAIALSMSIVWMASMDQFHENSNVYKLAHAEDSTSNRYSDASSVLLAPVVMEAFPEVTDYCQYLWAEDMILGTKENHVKENGFYVDEGWFRMLSFPLIYGDPNHVLSDRNSIVLSEKLSEKLFGLENPVGKTINMHSSAAMEPHRFTIAGVFQNVPINSSLQFEFVIPFAWYNTPDKGLQSWGYLSVHSYIQVAPDTNIEKLNQKITDLIRSKNSHMNDTQVFRLVPLHKSNGFVYTLAGDPFIGFFIMIALAIVGILILLISIINYINLSVATSLKRAKEIGTKKIHGATRKDLVFQFFIESSIVAGISALLASVMLIYMLQLFLSNITVPYTIFLNPTVFMIMAGLLIFTVVVTTWYPAVHMSKFSPVAIRQEITGAGSKLSFWRKFLVTLQFVAAIILITTSLVLSKQVDLMLNQSLGMDRFGIVFFTSNMPLEQSKDAFAHELMRKPGIESVTFSDQLPFGISSNTPSISWEGKNPLDEHWFVNFNAGDNYATTMKLKLLEGEDLSEGIHNQVLVNRAAVEIMQMDHPVGKSLNFQGTEKVIVGVVDNFKPQVFYYPNAPVIILHAPEYSDKVLIRLTENNKAKGLESLQEVFSQFSNDFILDYTFLDLHFNQQIGWIKNLGRTMSILGFLAIFIACIGLLGLTVHTSERRIKELGIRKINGAGVMDLIVLLSSQITRRILIASAVAFPLAFFINQAILQYFPERTPITVVPFIWSFIILVGLTSLIVGWHIVWVAKRNPVEALRFE